MIDDENERRRVEIEDLCVRAIGLAMPDRLVEWLGIGRRSAERWLSGALSWPEPIVEKLRTQAPLADGLMEDLSVLTKVYKDKGMHENLIKMRMKDFARLLSDEPPEKEAPRRKSADS